MKTSIEFNKVWIRENFELFSRRLFDFHKEYSESHDITVDESRNGFITYIAKLEKETV